LEIIYKNLTKSHINQVHKICQEKLGEGYLHLEHFKKLSEENKIIIALKDNIVLGFLTIDFLPEKEFFIYKRINKVGENNNVLIFNTCAVKSEKCGIGTELVKFAIKNFAQNFKTIYCCAWQHNNHTNIHKLLSNFNFKKELKINNYWYDESLGVENFCPICNTPCFCNLILYKKSCNT